MREIFTLFLFSVVTFSLRAQTVARNSNSVKSVQKSPAAINLNGQWKGEFIEKRGTSPVQSLLQGEGTPAVIADTTTYVLELKLNGNIVSGYSYTYFKEYTYGRVNRYFTICRINGVADPATQSIHVTEIERIKYNTPPYWGNCFQIHKLRYVKEGSDKEYLKGEWVPAPQQAGCGGQGYTVLSRVVARHTPFAVKVPGKKNNVVAQNTKPPVRKPATRPVIKPQPPAEKDAAPKTEKATAPIPVEKEVVRKKPEIRATIPDYPPTPVPKGYEERTNKIVKSIKVENPVFQVDFYDNGQIDGDSISVFFNGKLILSHKMLTTQPLTVTLSYDKRYKNNVITMYAENLGAIPPNTALMIVRDGDNRHEVRMESNLSNSGSVVFTHEKNE